MPNDDEMIEQHRVWEGWAQADPLWAILSDPTRKGGRWELSEFFASGDREIQLVLSQLEERDLHLTRGRCLDFGCGVGRLTQALAKVFERSDGVDISETMIDLARQHNQFGERCVYHVNRAADLALFDDASFDFVFSTIVLQHNPPDAAEHYITEFVRILSPGGIGVFDMTADLRGVALPEHSHRAELTMVAPRSMEQGASGKVRVTVRNTSGTSWPAGTRLGIGNHWRSQQGSEMVVQDDGRHALAAGLEKGATVGVDLSVTAPPRPGTYRLEIDLVEEGVCWFADRGSATTTSVVQVTPPSFAVEKRIGSRLARSRPVRLLRRASSTPADDDPVAVAAEPTPFAMNGLPPERVRAAVVGSGGEVADVVFSGSGGEMWDGYRYFVRRPAHRRPSTGD